MDSRHGDEEWSWEQNEVSVKKSRRVLLVASYCIIKPGELFLAHLFTSLQNLSVGEFHLLHSEKPFVKHEQVYQSLAPACIIIWCIICLLCMKCCVL